jgi:hypothetical protein
MVTLSRAYPDAHGALRAAQAIAAAGVPAGDIRVVVGSRVHDVRGEQVGRFAGTLAPSAVVGSFGNRSRARWQGTGSFAGDADAQRKGCFADADRELVIRYAGVRERAEVVGERQLPRVLRDAALDAHTQATIHEQLEQGHAVVLVALAEIAPGAAQACLDAAA